MADDASTGKAPFEMGGLDDTLGVKLVSATSSEVVAEVALTPRLHQPMGITHGGLYCSVVETICSVGAAISAAEYGRVIVGVDNHTSFLKATREGVLRATAKPLTRGRKTQLWQADIVDAEGALVATGRVRILCLEPSQPLAGKAAVPGSS